MAETLFISDLHLDAERKHIMTGFLRLLEEEAANADALYILGDLFEYWIGDDDPAEPMQPALAGLKALSARGIPVYFQHGNRDFLIGDGFCQRTGCTLLPEVQVIDLYGSATLVMHGDILCTDDVAYQTMRAQFRDPLFQERFLAQPLPARAAQARALRERSEAAQLGKSDAIMDVNADAVREAFQDHNVDRLIHGHTHRPHSHPLDIDGKTVERIVLGDWYEQGSVLRCSSNGCQLETWTCTET